MKPLGERLTNRELIQRGDLTLAFRARDSVLDRPVFVKALNPALAADEEIRARFEREAKAVARLDHPNLVRIYEYGEDPDEGLYMLLEWIEGGSLSERMRSKQGFAVDALSNLAKQLLSGLAALHGVGILHRDLKPDNILVCRVSGNREELFKITDFSLAALRDAPRLTHHEAIVGTPAYMAPEQAAGGAPSESSDLFSLGVILYEAVTGENPFAAPSMLETLQRLREFDPEFQRPEILALPETLQGLLRRLLQKDPSMRFDSADDALRFIGDRPAEPNAAAPRPSRARGYLILILVLAAVLLSKKWLFDNSPIVDYVLLFAAAAGLIVFRGPWKFAKTAPRPRNPKRDAKYLGIALALVAFWAGMMLWFPWTKDEPQPAIPPITQTAAPDTAHTTPASAPTDTVTHVRPSEPEFRAPAPESRPDDKSAKPETTVSAVESVRQAADSVDLVLTTEPWAYVIWNGSQIGTTPLGKALRLPRGDQTLLLRNPAFPPVEIHADLREKNQRLNVRLAEHATLLRVTVEPWGELYVDDEHIGTTPLPQPLIVAPGTHTLRVSHPQLKTLQKAIQVAGGDTLNIFMDLAREEASVKPMRNLIH